MKRIVTVLIFMLVIAGGLYYLLEKDFFSNWDKLEEEVKTLDLPNIKSEQEKKELLPLLQGDLYALMDEPSKSLEEQFGKPDYKNLTPYGYTWWVYTDGETNFIQFGVEDEKIITIFATGEDVSLDPFEIGESYDTIKDKFPIEEKVSYQDGLAFYTFVLQEEDIALHPLIKISDDLFVQCYMDSFTNKLSSIRLIKGDILLKQRFYEMEYRGTLPETETLTDKEWKKVEAGMEQQIFDLTNVYRTQFKVPQLMKDDQVREVAFLHSKDMFDHQYFSHYSEDGDGLKERLAEQDVYYLSAGENIAAQYTDGPAAMEGWLNSEGHREALLYEDYTHLGVGVYRLYYTQNFLLKP